MYAKKMEEKIFVDKNQFLTPYMEANCSQLKNEKISIPSPLMGNK